MADADRRKYLAEIALMYYDDHMTQHQIAAQLGVSRSSVSRLLDEARHEGVVEIMIHYPWRTVAELGEALKSRFGVVEARVLLREKHDYNRMIQGLGNLAARYLSDILGDGAIVGITWGTAVYHTIMAMRPMYRPSIEVVQMLGSVGSEYLLLDGPEAAQYDGTGLAQLLAQTVGGRYRRFPAPLLVEDWAVREALLQERDIREILYHVEQAHIALVGIGSLSSDLYSLLRVGYVSQAEMEVIRQAGAVGDICGVHYNIDGQVLDIGLNRRVMGVSLEKLTEMGCVIGVAGSVRKAPAILGALRAGYINVLFTDERAAREVLRLDDLGVTAATFHYDQQMEMSLP